MSRLGFGEAAVETLCRKAVSCQSISNAVFFSFQTVQVYYYAHTWVAYAHSAKVDQL